MLRSRGPNFGVSRLKIRVLGQILHFMPPSRGSGFFFSCIEVHGFGHKLDTLCSTRADPILAFRELKSVFKVKN